MIHFKDSHMNYRDELNKLDGNANVISRVPLGSRVPGVAPMNGGTYVFSRRPSCSYRCQGKLS